MADFVINTNTNRLISTKTALYRKLKKLGQIKDIEKTIEKPTEEKVEQPAPEPEKRVVDCKVLQSKAPEPAEPEPEFDESKLQRKLADISTSVVKKNMKQILKNQKLSDDEYDMLLKKMLFKKLCLDEPAKPKKKEKPAKKKGKKFKLVEPSSEDESESE
jgi:hypothetical protein